MEWFDEISGYHRSALTLYEKYARLYDLLDRMCKQQTAGYGTDFSNLFSRLYAICTHTGMPRNAIEHFRVHARHILHHEEEPDEETYLYDLKALCEAVAFLYSVPIPASLQAVLPATWRRLADRREQGHLFKRLRLVVDHWDNRYIYGYSEDSPTESPLQVVYSDNPVFADLSTLLYSGVQLNLLTVRVDEEGMYLPEQIVLEPDYLVDISTLAECYQNYGHHPMNYLVQRFKPRETTHHILLGNAANQFLDDCVNELPGMPATYERSMQKVFRNSPLAYCCCDGIDKDFFDRARRQFGFIRDTVQAVFHSPVCRIEKDGALLEPSFLCECMGLQGRMDFLQGDFRNLIELKSGKAEGMGLSLRAKESHALQMALYKEVLYYNLDIPRDAVNSYLFYSQYPKLFAERTSKAQIQRAMALRNHIVANERSLRNDGGRSLWAALTPESLNTRGTGGKLWENYQLPQLKAFLRPFREADSLTEDYFYTFTAFVAREQQLAKTGNARPESDGGFSSVWNSDLQSKLSAGNILADLKIEGFVENEGIEKVILSVPSRSGSYLPNFRKGDIVLLYEREEETDKATNKQVIRGSLELMEQDKVVVSLRNKQRGNGVFDLRKHYAIEHDFMESSFNTLYKGLYALLTAPESRRELILCQREPETDSTVTLSGHYPNPQIEHIVLQAKQAKDCFLLVGPPGTGKTSVAMRSIVEEFHASPSCNLLLLSYTNRAVDEICEMLETITPVPDYLRIGHELSCEPRFHARLASHRFKECGRRSDICRSLDDIRIVVGTVSSISSQPEILRMKHFEVAIVDEASQILEPQIMGILCAHENGEPVVGKFILIGDHKQLPAVVLQRPEDSAVANDRLRAIGLTDCRNSLFERLHTRLRSKGDTCQSCAMLDRQGRMHPHISDFVNRYFYEGRLDVVPVPHQCAPLEWQCCHQSEEFENWTASTRLGFIDTPYPPVEDSNKINRHEAVVTARLVQAIYHLCITNAIPFDAARRIGIIVPFRNQISLIAEHLSALHIPETQDITIDTVERYQGSQRDIIIYSTTVSQPYQLDILSVPVCTDGVTIDRKLNVALTRARKQMFIVGNSDLLGHHPIYKSLIEFIKEKKGFRDGQKLF